jgi:hypothetical protein
MMYDARISATPIIWTQLFTGLESDTDWPSAKLQVVQPNRQLLLNVTKYSACLADRVTRK